MPEELQDQSYTTEDEENDTDYSTQPKEAMDNPDEDGVIDDDILEESPVGDLDSAELDELADEENSEGEAE